MSEAVPVSSLKELNAFTVGPITVRTEQGEVISDERIERRGISTILSLAFREPDLDLKLEMQRIMRNSRQHIAYNGQIQFGGGVERPQDAKYFENLARLLGECSLSATRFYFGNVSLVSNGQYNVAMVGLNKDSISVTNSYTGQGQELNKGVNVSLHPRSLDELNDNEDLPGVNGDFRLVLTTSLLAAAALAQTVKGGDIAPLDIVVAGRGTYRYDKDKQLCVPIQDRLPLLIPRSGAPPARQPRNILPTAFAGPKPQEPQPAPEALRVQDLGHSDEVNQRLNDVIYAYKNPRALEKWGAELPRGILLYGPDVESESALARAMAGELGAEFWEIDATKMLDKWQGTSEKNMHEVFAKATKKTKLTVMFWSNVDASVGISDENSRVNESASRRSMANIFRREIVKLQESNPNVIVIASGNNPEKCPGSYDVKLYISLPTEASRSSIWASQIAERLVNSENHAIFDTDINIPQLTRLTDNWTHADIQKCLRRLTFRKAIAESRTGELSTPINQAEIIHAIETFKRD